MEPKSILNYIRMLFLLLFQLSVINYGIAFWGQSHNSHVISLKSTLTRVIQFIFKTPKIISNDIFVYDSLNLFSITNVFYKNVLITFYKLNNNISHDLLITTRF